MTAPKAYEDCKIAKKKIPKKWGHEIIIDNFGLYCGKLLYVAPSTICCSVHYHAQKTETFHVLSGALALEMATLRPPNPRKDYSYLSLKDFYPPLVTVLTKDETIRLKPYTAHRFFSAGGTGGVGAEGVCTFVEISTHDRPEDSIRLISSGPTPTASKVAAASVRSRIMDMRRMESDVMREAVARVRPEWAWVPTVWEANP